MTDFELKLSDKEKKAIAQGIYDGVAHDIPEMIQEQHLLTDLGKGIFRYNFMYRNITENLDGEFQYSIKRRGAWKVLLLFEAKSGITFSIMSESNFRRLQKNRPLYMHYIEPLIDSNEGFEPIEGQIRWDLGGEDTARDPEMLQDLRAQLLSEFAGITTNHIIILFDYNNFTRSLKVKAVLVTPEFEIAYSESWTSYIEKTYPRTEFDGNEDNDANKEDSLITFIDDKENSDISAIRTNDKEQKEK